MLAESLVAHVAELLADGRISQRRIARLTGVSRGTVGAIARGRRPLDLRPKCADEDAYRPVGPPARCRGCGGKVYMPCQLCRVRALAAIERRLRESERQSAGQGGSTRQAGPQSRPLVRPSPALLEPARE